MGIVLFYHQTRTTPADTLAVNLPRALGQGWRAMVRGTDAGALDRLDGELWLKGADDSFLPHGLEGGPHDAVQPVLLGQGAPVNGAKVLALIDGAEATEAEFASMERVWVLFADTDEPQKAQARTLWKALSAAGQPAQYWSEEGGRWEKKADSVKA